MSVISLNLERILDKLNAIQDPNEKGDYLFNELAIAKDTTKIDAVKKSATKKDFDRLVGMLQDTTVEVFLKAWAAQMLATIGSDKHSKILENALFKSEYLEIRSVVFLSLLSTKSTFPIAPRLKLIFRSLEEAGVKVDDTYLKSVEKTIKEKGLTQEFLDHLALETNASEEERIRTIEDGIKGLMDLSSSNANYKAELAKYHTTLNQLLNDYLSLDFSRANLKFDISVNAAQILDSLDYTQDIIEAIQPQLAGNYRSVYLAGKYGSLDFVNLLASELKNENQYAEDAFFWVSYREFLIKALGELGHRFRGTKKLEDLEEKTREDLEEAIEVLTKMLCRNINVKGDETLSMNLLRTVEKIQGDSKTAEYVVSRIMDADDIFSCGYLQMLVLLNDKPTAFKTLEDSFHKGKPDERIKAEEAIRRMGLSEAVDLLITKQVDRIFSDYIAAPIKEVEKKSVEILEKTVNQITRTCNVNTIMSIVVFAVGISVIIFGAALALTATDPAELWIGSGSIIGGILTSMLTFLKGPVNTVQNAVADLAQVETAILYNVRSTGLASFAFLTEYLKQKEPNIEVLEDCTSKMKDSARNTMFLIELYGSGNEAFKDYPKEKLVDALIGVPAKEKAPEIKTPEITTPTTDAQGTATNPE